MGVLCDLFAATELDASSLTLEDVQIQKFGGVDAKGLNPVPFATLQNILTGIDVQEGVRQHSLVAELSEDGPWVYRLPSALCSALATTSDTDMPAIATQWAATDELQMSGWQVPDAEAVLTQMIALCRSAAEDGKDVFVWNSL